MREIKFRGKRMDNGGWVYGDLLQGNFSMFIVDMVNTINGNKLFDLNYYEVLPETIGQFTGLKDKNGVEIYEGDVILFASHHLQVYWDKHLAGFVDGSGDYIGEKAGSCEIIGNIHDNAELLKCAPS